MKKNAMSRKLVDADVQNIFVYTWNGFPGKSIRYWNWCDECKKHIDQDGNERNIKGQRFKFREKWKSEWTNKGSKKVYNNRSYNILWN